MAGIGPTRRAPQAPVSASQIGNPPIFDVSAVTSEDFCGDPARARRTPCGFRPGTSTKTDKIPNIVFPYNIYGNYCINCHASAEQQSTFASINNLLGPGIRYKHLRPPSTQPPILHLKGSRSPQASRERAHRPPLRRVSHRHSPDRCRAPTGIPGLLQPVPSRSPSPKCGQSDSQRRRTIMWWSPPEGPRSFSPRINASAAMTRPFPTAVPRTCCSRSSVQDRLPPSSSISRPTGSGGRRPWGWPDGILFSSPSCRVK